MKLSKIHRGALIAAAVICIAAFMGTEVFASCGACGAPNPPYAVYGIVYNGGTPVSGATVTMACTGGGCGPAVATCVTNSLGEYSFLIGSCPDAPTGGDYDLTVFKADPGGCSSSSPVSITWYVNPPTACNINQDLTCS